MENSTAITLLYSYLLQLNFLPALAAAC